jgi:hypothetical protein
VLRKRTPLLVLLVAGLAAAAFGAARALSGTETPMPFDTEPASKDVVHARVVVDGKEWRVRTYRNKEGQLCAFQGVVGGGEGGTCLDTGTLFAREPVVLYYGSGQDTPTPGVWDRAWTWGFASDRVARLELTLSNCAILLLHVDSAGIFHHVFSTTDLHHGILPAKVVARDSTGATIFSETVKLDPAIPAPATGSCH